MATIGYDQRAWDGVEPESARRVLLAAVEAFSERGFHAATTRAIGEAAGLSPAGVYVHYKSKSDLLYEICRVSHQVTLTTAPAVLADAGDDPVERINAFVHSFAKWHAENHVLARVIHYELGNLPPEQYRRILAIRSEITALLRNELAQGAASGAFRVEDVDGTTDAILSLSLDLGRWYTPSSGRTPDDIGTLYAHLVLGMLRAAER